MLFVGLVFFFFRVIVLFWFKQMNKMKTTLKNNKILVLWNFPSGWLF